MKASMKKSAPGFFLALISAAVAAAALVRFLIWAPRHNAMDPTIVGAIVFGMIFTLILALKNAAIMSVMSCAAYSYALFRHLANQAGSFADAYQGIHMFGDSTQVGNVIQIAVIMGIGLLIMLVSSFLEHRKVKE